MKFGLMPLFSGFTLFAGISLANASEPPSINMLGTKQNLLTPTRFQSPAFSALAPQGWSANLAGAVGNFSDSLTLAPTSDLEHSESYMGIHTMSSPPALTLEQRQAKLSNPPGKTLRFVNWNGNKWLLAEYVGKSVAGNPIKQWLAFCISKNTEYLVSAGAPQNADTFWKNAEAIMKSLQLRPK